MRPFIGQPFGITQRRLARGDQNIHEFIDGALRGAERAAALVSRLLSFSRQQPLSPERTDANRLLSGMEDVLRRTLPEDIRIEFVQAGGLWSIHADAHGLESAIVNLAVNARDAMLGKGAGGKLTIQTRSASIAEVRRRGTDIMPIGDYTALEITDTGTGIPPDVLPKIFEPFFTTKDTGKGTGLGLSTVYGIVKQSGGYIFADSRPGQGATFTIYLPVHAAGEDAAAAVPSGRKPRAGDLWGSGTILLVEDEDMVRAVAERALARQGYTIVSAENGEAALELLLDVLQDPAPGGLLAGLRAAAVGAHHQHLGEVGRRGSCGTSTVEGRDRLRNYEQPRLRVGRRPTAELQWSHPHQHLVRALLPDSRLS